MKPGTVGLKRTGFKRKAPAPRQITADEIAMYVPGAAPPASAPGPVKCSSIKKRRTKRRQEDSDPEYMGRVAALGCCICRLLGLGATPAEVHHRRGGTGGGKRAPDSETCPLCYEHHRGNTGIHGLGRKRFERTYKVTEQELIEQTQKELGR